MKLSIFVLPENKIVELGDVTSSKEKSLIKVLKEIDNRPSFDVVSDGTLIKNLDITIESLFAGTNNEENCEGEEEEECKIIYAIYSLFPQSYIDLNQILQSFALEFPCSSVSGARKRIVRELKDMASQTSESVYFTFSPVNFENLYQISAVLVVGPGGGAFAHRGFSLMINLPQEYPFREPKMTLQRDPKEFPYLFGDNESLTHLGEPFLYHIDDWGPVKTISRILKRLQESLTCQLFYHNVYMHLLENNIFPVTPVSIVGRSDARKLTIVINTQPFIRSDYFSNRDNGFRNFDCVVELDVLEDDSISDVLTRLKLKNVFGSAISGVVDRIYQIEHENSLFTQVRDISQYYPSITMSSKELINPDPLNYCTTLRSLGRPPVLYYVGLSEEFRSENKLLTRIRVDPAT